MANIKTTPAQWVKVKAYIEAGLSFSQISSKTGISKPQIGSRAKREGWSKQTETRQLIVAAVGVEEAKQTLLPVELEVHNELVRDKVKLAEFFTHAAIRNVQEAINAPCEGQADYKSRADTIAKGRDSALGKDATTSVNIDNSQTQINTIEVVFV